MNLAMHGDGSTNILHANSLLPPGEWQASMQARITLGGFDAVFTNPPFGSRLPIDDPHILDQFELSRFGAKGPRSSMPPEQLFIERCLRFLKPGGRMAIVLPDSILSNPGLEFIRRWLLRRVWVIASIDLPREAFAKSETHTMTSVLILQAFTEAEQERAEIGALGEYEIFMAIADRVGWDLRGNPVYLRTPEGEEILRRAIRRVPSRDARGNVVEDTREVEEPVLDDQLPSVVQQFSDWLSARPHLPWLNA
jgi:type I restriction enzyme M protein